MSDPVTEIVALTLVPDVELSVFATARTTMLAQPGCRRLRVSLLHEDPNQARLFVDWDSVADHEAFTKTPDFAKVMTEQLLPQLAGPPSSAVHAKLDPYPAAVLYGDSSSASTGKGGLLEMLSLYFASGTPETDVAQGFVAEFRACGAKGFTGHLSAGWVREDVVHEGETRRLFVILCGWESVEAHGAFRATEDSGRLIPKIQALEGLRGRDVFHVRAE
ncbi:Uu.00g011660.m01.CDS01 [Anthostomella pinea]|uniref:Uu.00g011660.m01.CDS01 n=1 Tax=Anthostomella pinea TaxID=933095 RepID=A0AAI8VXU5_9PEZI|nr:Uu.00g011660.m01.CDS01 [Anthostomella pinea]